MLANLKLSDWGTILAVILALGGLVYRNGEAMNGLQTVTEQHGDDIRRIDRTIEVLDDRQREDHSAIVKMQAGIDFLVQQAKNKEGGR